MKTPDNDLTAQELILVSLLAATDAIWTPCRESHDGGRIAVAVVNSWEARTAYRAGGLPWASGGRSDAERKELQRSLADLEAAGDVVVSRPNGVKSLFARLSDSAYDRLRRQCGLAGLEIGSLMLKLVAQFSYRPATLMQHQWIREPKLNGGRGWGDGNHGELYEVAQRAMPSLMAGWLKTNCDCECRIYYAVTDAGWKLLDDGWKPVAGEDVKRDSRFELAYWEQLGVERKRLLTKKPQCAIELGTLPLPVSHHDLPLNDRPLQ